MRRLDPVGTCTADYMESLLVQVGLKSEQPEGLQAALSHLELLQKGKMSEVAKLIHLDEEKVKRIFQAIKELVPFPGRSFGHSKVRYVIPDIQVAKKEGEFVIVLNEEEIPVLGLNPFFMQIADTRKVKGEAKVTRDFARENIKEARWFINSINQRNHTLLRVCRTLVEFQRAFFVHGPKHLAPLTLNDIAGELGLHTATISRISHGKYVQTEWGIFELRHFFTNSISGAGSSGSKYSKEGVKQIIKEIIEGEESRLADQDIVEILAKRGINIARRTVAKYRNELDVKPSFDR